MVKAVRKGRVSSVDYDNGMISVTYPDDDDNTTVKNASFSWTDEYKMPRVGEFVLVVHETDGDANYVLGRLWNKRNTCLHTGSEVWRKELAPNDKYGKCYMDYDDEEEKLTIRVPKKLEIIVGDCPEHGEPGEIEIKSIGTTPKVTIKAEGEETAEVNVLSEAQQSAQIAIQAQADEVARIAAETQALQESVIRESSKLLALINELTTNAGLYQGEQDVIAEGVSLEHHAHECGSSGPPAGG